MFRTSFKTAAAVIALALPAASPAGAAAPEEKVLNIFNWSDYIAPDTIANFEKATGIKVNYDVFDSNEVLEAKLLAGQSGYDLVVPTASFLERQIKAGVFQPLDKAALTNYANLDPAIVTRIAKHDPENARAMPYTWGTIGIGYNPDKIKERLGTDTITSWDVLFKPEISAKLKDCGIAILDSPSEVMAIALNYAGLDPNSEKKEDLETGKAVLQKLRPNVKYFNSSQYINDLANGSVCVAVGYNGDLLQARNRAAEAKNGVTLRYSIPSEGTLMWFDVMAIPNDARHPQNAHAFLNYLLQPDVIAAVSNTVNYANANKAATPLVTEAVRNDPGIYPPDAVRDKLFAQKSHTVKFDRLLTRAWTELKTGR